MSFLVRAFYSKRRIAFDAYLGALPRANAIRRGRTAVLVRFPSAAKRRGVAPLRVT